MTKENNTRRALLGSVISLLLCVAMLIGSTFAWFTDSATTKVNTIQAGNLEVLLMMKEGNNWVDAEGKTLEFKTADGRDADDILWEPGCTYELPALKIVNDGNLALKFKAIVSNITGDTELADVLDVKISTDGVNFAKIGTLTELIADPDGFAYGFILPKDKDVDTSNATAEEIAITSKYETAEYTIALHMQETAGNKYQNKKIENMAVTVFATQYTYEKDSYSNKYDGNAEYDESYAGYKTVIVKNQDELEGALNNAVANEPVIIQLSGDSNTYQFPTWTEYNGSLKNKTIVFKADGDKTFDATFFNVNGTQNLVGADLTFDGVNVDFPINSYMSNGYTGINLAGGKVVFKNATISGAQYLYVPTAEFINCVFENSANSYSVVAYSNGNVKFDGCTFNTAGKAILLYSDGAVTVNATLTNCIFNSDGTMADDKAAVETGDDGSKSSKFDISFTNCKANGFVTNNSTSNLWGNKVNSNMPQERLNVVIDGVDVY